jgi:hypothetical protein
VGLFTVELELGRETRAMIERVARETREMLERLSTNVAVELELGPNTRETLHRAEEDAVEETAKGKLGRLVGK